MHFPESDESDGQTPHGVQASSDLGTLRGTPKFLCSSNSCFDFNLLLTLLRLCHDAGCRK